MSKQNSTQKHIRGSSLLLIGRLVALALNFGVQLLTVRYLSKDDFGAFAYALSVVSMGASVALFGLDKAIARFVPIYEEHRDYQKLFGALVMTAGVILGIGLCMILLVFALQQLLLEYFISSPLSLALLLIVIALAPMQALDSWFQGVFAIFASPTAIFFRRHILGPGLKLAAVLLIMLTQSSVYALAFAYLVAGFIGVSAYAAMLPGLWQKQGLMDQFNLSKIKMPAREIFSFSTPLLTTDVVLVLKSSMVVVLLEYLWGTTGVADFRAVLPIAGLNLVVMQSFKFLYTPLAARLFAQNDKNGINDLYWQTAVWIAVISFPVFAVSFSLAQPLTLFLFGTRYAESGTILAILSLGNYFNAALGFNSYTLRVYGRVRYIVTIDLLSSIISLGFSLWLIPAYGALGAAVAVSGTLIIYNILNHIGLLFGTGIDLFQWRYLKIYLMILFSAIGLFLIQVLGSPPLYISIVLAGVTFLILVRLNNNTLDVIKMFPELRRIPLIQPLLGA
jgi:O-antigen/teichoic acid export membrane protein